MEQLPKYIPRLDPTGANWAIFRLHFKQAMIACRRWPYLEGTKARPVPKDEAKPTEEEAAELEAWDHNDFMARFLLSQRTPDTSSLALSHCSTAKEAWTKLTTEYQAKSSYAQNDLEQSFLDMRCAKGEDVRTFLKGLQYKRDELAAAGVTVSDRDYRRTVLRGIPGRLAEFASWLLTSRGSSNPIDTDTLIGDICEEADRTKNRRGKDRDQQGKTETKQQNQTDEALAASDTNASGSNGRRKRRQGDCHNCGKAGHWARDCRAPKKEEGSTPEPAQAPSEQAPAYAPPATKTENKPVGSANTAVADDVEGDGFFMAIEEVDRAQVEHAVPDPLMGEADMLKEETRARFARAEELFDGSGSEDWLDQEAEDLLIAGETAGAVLTEDDSNLTPVPSSRSESKLALHMAPHAPASNRALDEEGYRACSGGGDSELVHPRGDGAGQAARNTHRPMGLISDTSVCKLVAGRLKGTLLERARVLTHASGISKALWGRIKCSGTTAPLEGEQNFIHISSARGEQPAAPQISTSPPPATPSSTPVDTAPSTPAQVNAPGEPPEHLRRSAPPILSCPVRDVQTEEGAAPPSHARASQMPGPLVEAGGAWAVEHGADAPAPLEDPEGNEFTLEEETSDAEATEPRTLVEAERQTDRPQRAKEIDEPNTLKVAGTWRSEEASLGTDKRRAADAAAAATLESDASKGDPTVIATHADDCTVVATFLHLTDSLKAAGLSWPYCTQGTEIKLDPEARITHLSQHAYIDATLRRLHLDKLKSLSILTHDTAADALKTALHSAKVKYFTTSLDCARNEGECRGMQSRSAARRRA
jgi:hypothetical protein